MNKTGYYSWKCGLGVKIVF